MTRLPLETQTLYADFLEQLVAARVRRSMGQVPGCFTTKTIKGDRYYYFQYSDPGGTSRQAYIGKQSPALDKLVTTFQRERGEQQADAEHLARLCAQLRAGGALVTDAASARILAALADCGVFHLGGVLVGTHAFAVLGNLLGVRWEGAFLRTQDIDIAGPAQLGIAIPDIQADIPKVLDSLRMGFIPVPPLNPKHPSTSFKVRGKAVRVDFLTPEKPSHKGNPVFISRFRVAAQPLRFLDYLLDQHQPGGVVNGSGILVNVPQPARYAFHKLLVARSRSLTSQTKADKDLQQAAQLLEILAEERPGDLLLAWDDLQRRGRGWTQRVVTALSGLAQKNPELVNKVMRTVPALKSATHRSAG